MKKKLLAGFMTLCMLLSLLPSAAFAVETEAESSTEQTVPVKEEAGSQPRDARLIWISVGLLYRSPTVAPMLPLKTMGP